MSAWISTLVFLSFFLQGVSGNARGIGVPGASHESHEDDPEKLVNPHVFYPSPEGGELNYKFVYPQSSIDQFVFTNQQGKSCAGGNGWTALNFLVGMGCDSYSYEEFSSETYLKYAEPIRGRLLIVKKYNRGLETEITVYARIIKEYDQNHYLVLLTSSLQGSGQFIVPKRYFAQADNRYEE